MGCVQSGEGKVEVAATPRPTRNPLTVPPAVGPVSHRNQPHSSVEGVAPTAPLQTPEMTLSSSSRGPSSFVGHVVNESRPDLPQFNELQLALGDTYGSLEGSRTQQVQHRRRRQPSSSHFSPSSEALAAGASVETTLRRLHRQLGSGSQRSSNSADGLAREPESQEGDPVQQWLQHLASRQSSLAGSNGNPTQRSSSSFLVSAEEVDSLMMSRKSARSSSVASAASSLMVYGGGGSVTSAALLSPKLSPRTFTGVATSSRRSVSRTPPAAGVFSARQSFLFPSFLADDGEDHPSRPPELDRTMSEQSGLALGPTIVISPATNAILPVETREDEVDV